MKFKLSYGIFGSVGSEKGYVGITTKDINPNDIYLVYTSIVNSTNLRYTSRVATFYNRPNRMGKIGYGFPDPTSRVRLNIFKKVFNTGVYNTYITALKANIKL